MAGQVATMTPSTGTAFGAESGPPGSSSSHPELPGLLPSHAKGPDAEPPTAKVSQGWGVTYRGLLDAAPDAMVVVNASGAIVLLNVHAQNQFGYLGDELVGMPVATIISGFAERLIADDNRTADHGHELGRRFWA